MTYAVIDRATQNILGEYPDVATARALYERLVAADPSVATDLEIREVRSKAPKQSTSVAFVGSADLN
jgi:hypothetical protein